MAGKTNKSQSKRPASLTEANKRKQKAARERKAKKRLGQFALKRKDRREFLKEKRLQDPSYARKLPTPDGEVKQNALNKDSRDVSQIIFSCTYTPHRD